MKMNSEWLKIYKKECKAYFAYDSHLKRALLELEEINITIQNIHSPATDHASSHNNTSQDSKLLGMIEVKNEIEFQITYYKAILQWIKDVNNAISSPAYRAITWQTLIQAKNRMDLLINYDVDPDYVYRMRDKFIITAFNETLKQQYLQIQEMKNKSKWLSFKI